MLDMHHLPETPFTILATCGSMTTGSVPRPTMALYSLRIDFMLCLESCNFNGFVNKYSFANLSSLQDRVLQAMRYIIYDGQVLIY